MSQSASSQPDTAGHFGLDRLETISDVEVWHFWHEPRRRLLLDTVQPLLKPGARVLDVGCGTGTFCRHLAQAGYSAHGVDPWADRLEGDHDLFQSGVAECLPSGDEEFDVVCALDLLEHVDDERAASEAYRVLIPGGAFLVSVPAFPFLWSERDRVAGHRRRYGRRSLRALLCAAGFQVERLFGFQFLLLPLLVLNRTLRSRTEGRARVAGEDRPNRHLNVAMRAINRAEVTLGRWVRPPFGSSLIAVARKPATGAPGRRRHAPGACARDSTRG